jgi:hypothetical protein
MYVLLANKYSNLYSISAANARPSQVVIGVSNHKDKGELPVNKSNNQKRVLVSKESFGIKLKVNKSNNNDWKDYQIEDSRGFWLHSHSFGQFTLFDLLIRSSVCRGFNLRFSTKFTLSWLDTVPKQFEFHD